MWVGRLAHAVFDQLQQLPISFILVPKEELCHLTHQSN